MVTRTFLIVSIILFFFINACTPRDKAIMQGGIKTVNTVKSIKGLTKEGVKENIYNNTKRAIEQIGR